MGMPGCRGLAGAVFAAALALSACGGGGGSDSDAGAGSADGGSAVANSKERCVSELIAFAQSDERITGLSPQEQVGTVTMLVAGCLANVGYTCDPAPGAEWQIGDATSYTCTGSDGTVTVTVDEISAALT